jgi:hypothetical protein
MPDYAAAVTLPDTIRGDRWLGIPAIGPVLIGGVQPTNALTRMRFQFERLGESYVIDSDESTNPDAPVVIDDDETWEAHIPEVDDFLPSSGKWSWDAEFYEVGSTSPLTLLRGTIVVNDDISS